MDAETDQRDDPDAEENERRASGHLHALAGPVGRQHDEGQREPGGHLDAHPDRHRSARCAKPRTGTRRQQHRGAEQHHHQRVVVRAADRHHQEDGIQADECRRPAPRVAELTRRRRHKPDTGEAGCDGHRFERPQARGQAERRKRIARQRKQRAVRRVLVEPPYELKGRVGGRVGGHMCIGVEPVKRAQPGEVQVAEHVLGYERRPEEQDHVREHDRPRDRAHRKPLGDHQHEQIARAHDQHQRLEAPGCYAHVEALERTSQPAGPAPDARRHILGGSRGRPGGHQEDARRDRERGRPCRPSAAPLHRRERPSRGRRLLRHRPRPGDEVWCSPVRSAHCYV